MSANDQTANLCHVEVTHAQSARSAPTQGMAVIVVTWKDCLQTAPHTIEDSALMIELHSARDMRVTLY